ncbi:MAG: hypothetical protein RI556_03925 [Hydrogenovibrio sp.]|uniref:hypothetical protein n=1 Tax=Hydrogenovibrio sp. TaxID=2065821 RepID=UPI002870B17B|nr:hypothetical protein [Hydrogenovibrio sp.]MDR9498300.1 hypothetical protein [Hydrogenovibrio sp.]
MKKTVLTLSIFSLLAVGCAQTPDRAATATMPGWVAQTPESGDAFYAKGQAGFDPEADRDVEQAMDEAKNQARSHLSQRLQSQLNDWSESALTELSQRDRNVVMPKLARALKQQVTADLPTLTMDGLLNADNTTTQVFVDEQGQQVYAMVTLQKSQLGDILQTHTQQLATQMRDYLDVSSKGSHLQQVMSMAPALPTLMAYQRNQTLLANQFDLAPETESAQLASLFSRQFDRLVRDMIVRVDAVTRETEGYDTVFKQALVDQGYNLSARRPDVTVRYFIEPQTTGVEGAELLADVELIGVDGQAVTTLSDVYQGQGETPKLAERAAVRQLSAQITTSLVENAYGYAQKVNDVNFNR